MCANRPIAHGPYRAIDLEWTPPRRRKRGREAFAALIDWTLPVAAGLVVGIGIAFWRAWNPATPTDTIKTGTPENAGLVLPARGSSEPVASSTNTTQDTDTDMKTGIIDEAFLRRLSTVESGTNDAAFNPGENAHGRYQIREQYLADANEFMGTNYSLQDMHDPIKANTVVWAYLARWGTCFENRTGREATATDLARIHNGGPRGAERSCTLDYARRFEEAM